MDRLREPEWDHRLWDHVWERNLTQVERHNMGMAVLRHRPPGSPFEDLVALELARRWRRRAVVLVVMYGAWTAFWGALAFGPLPDDVERSPLPLGCTVVGVAAILSCLLVRHHLGRYLAMAAEPATSTLRTASPH